MEDARALANTLGDSRPGNFLLRDRIRLLNGESANADSPPSTETGRGIAAELQSRPVNDYIEVPGPAPASFLHGQNSLPVVAYRIMKAVYAGRKADVEESLRLRGGEAIGESH